VATGGPGIYVFAMHWLRRTRRHALAVAAVLLVSGCNAHRTTLWPYSDDDELDGLLARRAAASCHCLRAGTHLPPRRFTSDGCSMSPDEDWAGCCIAHDIAYWCGGSFEDRRRADDRLGQCVESLGHGRTLARAMQFGVRLGGAPKTPFPWRWGYGWSEIRAYEASDLPGDVEKCFGR
jgi:hypothetical protein